MNRVTLAAILCLVLIGLVAARSGDIDAIVASEVPCPVGGPPTMNGGGDFALPDGRPPVTSPVVFGCGALRHYGAFQAVGFRIGPTLSRSQLCTAADHPSGSAGICNRPGRGHEVNAATSRINYGGKPGWWEVDGRTTGRVATATARYRSQGRVRYRVVTVIRVTDPNLLAKFVVKKPLGFYAVEVAPDARRLFLIVRDSAGQVLESRLVRQLH
jgi:hypothetical protein